MRRRTRIGCLVVSVVVLQMLTTVPVPAEDGDPVIMAAGDIACSPQKRAFKGGDGTATKCRQKYTAQLLAPADWVLPLGDEQYEDGALSDFNASYDLSWGAFKANSRPVPGNHEYQTAGAAGYYAYFGDAAGESGRGYYAWDAGSWHLLALNSSISLAPGSAQYNWVRDELAAHSSGCTAAYWHEPRFKAGKNDVGRFKPVWELLYQYGADLVLNGHAHNYQRFAPLTPDGKVDVNLGLRQFIVGTGGVGFSDLASGDPRVERSQNSTYGVLKLTLHASGYDWQFLSEKGTWTDTGTGSCH